MCGLILENTYISMEQLANALRPIDSDQSDSWQQLAQQLDSDAPTEQEPAQVPASQAPSAAPVAPDVDSSVIKSEREALQRLKHLQDCAAPLLQRCAYRRSGVPRVALRV